MKNHVEHIPAFTVPWMKKNLGWSSDLHFYWLKAASRRSFKSWCVRQYPGKAKTAKCRRNSRVRRAGSEMLELSMQVLRVCDLGTQSICTAEPANFYIEAARRNRLAIEGQCYRLEVVFPPNSHVSNPIPQHDGIREHSLREVSTSWGWSPHKWD